MIQFDSTGLLSHSPRFNYYFIKFHVEDIDQYSKINFLLFFLYLKIAKIYIYINIRVIGVILIETKRS